MSDGIGDLLGRLEAAWRRSDAPVLGYLRPGLAPERIDELMAPTGLALPDELRAWWAWHDGANEPSTLDESREIGPGGWLHLPLSEAIELWAYHAGQYRMALEKAADIAALAWRPGLFPFTHRSSGYNHVLAVETDVDVHGPAPVTLVTEMGVEHHGGAGSFAAMLDLWIELLESDRYHVLDGHIHPRDWSVTEDERLGWIL